MEVKFYLTRPKKERSQVKATMWYNSKPFEYYESALSVKTSFWNVNRQRAKESRSYPEWFDLNASLDDVESKIKSCFRRYLNENGRVPTHQELRTAVQKERGVYNEPPKAPAIEFLDFVELFLQEMKDGKHLNLQTGRPVSPTTTRAYKQTKRLLDEYCAKRGALLTFQTINTEFHRDFVYFLSNEYKSETNGKSLKPNSVGKHITNIKSFMSYAVDRNITATSEFKKKGFRVIKEDVDSVFLNKAEIEALEDLELAYKSRQDQIRDIFVIGCYTGLRISDLKRLSSNHIKNINGEKFIEIEMHKTAKPVSIPINEKLQKLLLKYQTKSDRFFPGIYDQDVNDEIKDIAKEVEMLKMAVLINCTENNVRISKNIPKYKLLTNHTARRSFATNKVLEGYPYSVIMLITGHKTEKAFLRYVKLSGYHSLEMFKMHKERMEKVA